MWEHHQENPEKKCGGTRVLVPGHQNSGAPYLPDWLHCILQYILFCLLNILTFTISTKCLLRTCKLRILTCRSFSICGLNCDEHNFHSTPCWLICIQVNPLQIRKNEQRFLLYRASWSCEKQTGFKWFIFALLPLIQKQVSSFIFTNKNIWAGTSNATSN